MSRARVAQCVSGALALCSFVVTPARAANLVWSAPAECPAQSTIEEKIERSIGKPLREVYGVDFAVNIEQQQPRKWHLHLQTHARTLDAETRERELLGQSCAEVGEAAVLAIALAIAEQSRVATDQDAADLIDAPGLERAAPAPNGKPSDAPAPDPEVKPEVPPPSAAPTPLEFSLAAMLVLDTASLPSVAAGASLEIAMRYDLLKVIALGAFFPEREARLTDDVAAQFGLAFGGVLLCLQPTAEAVSMLGCAGIELGEMSAEGLVATRKIDSVPYRAVRAEVGGGYRFATRASAFLRLGMSVPLKKADFFVDGDSKVHSLGPVAGRAVLGIELFL